MRPAHEILSSRGRGNPKEIFQIRGAVPRSRNEAAGGLAAPPPKTPMPGVQHGGGARNRKLKRERDPGLCGGAGW